MAFELSSFELSRQWIAPFAMEGKATFVDEKGTTIRFALDYEQMAKIVPTLYEAFESQEMGTRKAP